MSDPIVIKADAMPEDQEMLMRAFKRMIALLKKIEENTRTP